MLARVGLEEAPEVGAARGQDDLVGGEGAAVAGQRDVHEVLFVPEVPERGEYGRVEVVPAQRVLLLGGGVAPHWADRGGNFYANGAAGSRETHDVLLVPGPGPSHSSARGRARRGRGSVPTRKQH